MIHNSWKNKTYKFATTFLLDCKEQTHVAEILPTAILRTGSQNLSSEELQSEPRECSELVDFQPYEINTQNFLLDDIATP